jgi:hypothetical protein
MRISFLLPTILLALAPCAVTNAQTVEIGKGLTVSVAKFTLSDMDANHSFGSPVGLTIDKRIRQEKKGELSLRLGWFHSSKKDAYSDGPYSGRSEFDLDLIPVMAIKRFGPAYTAKSGRGLYYGYGAGVAYTRTNSELTQISELGDYNYEHADRELNLSATVLIGWRFAKCGSAEISNLWGGDTTNTGTIVSIGARF